MNISVVIPVYRSENILPELCGLLDDVLKKHYTEYEIILIDDYSPDKSWSVIESLSEKKLHIKGIQLMKNSGQGSATLCGIYHSSGDIIITMDDDLQHPPEELPKLVTHLLNHPELDVVIGSPITKRHNVVRRFGSNFINRINSVFLGKDINLKFTGFRAFRKNVGEKLIKIQTPYPALGPLILQVTNRMENLPFNHHKRFSGKSNYSPGKIIRQTLSNFIGFSMIPLRILAVLGGIGILISIILGTYFTLRYFIVGVKTTGFTSLALILISISGFNFFAFAVLGEYVLRIVQITSSNPQYSVRKQTNINK